MTNSIQDLEKADVILLTGSNTTENHPVISLHIINAVTRLRKKLIVVDPRVIKMTHYADIYLRPRPGTDIAWLNGLAHIIIKEGLWDKDYVRERTEGFEAFAQTVEKYTPELVQMVTGIPAGDLKKAARLYAQAGRAAIVYCMGITQHRSGTDNVKAIANLAMLCGNVGIEGGGVNPLRGQNNVQGACDVGALPDYLPGYQKVIDPTVRRKFEEAWDARLPGEPGITSTEMIKQAGEGKIKGLYIMGENPMISDPDINHVRSVLENLEFLVVQDIFLTQTARLADVVLPAASYAEKEGTFTNTERRVQRVRQALSPPGQSRADWKIICDLSAKMGYEMSYQSAEEIMEEIASLTPIYGGIYYDRLEEAGIQWPCPALDHPGTPVLHCNGFTRGKGLFHALEVIPASEMPDDDYPFLLSTGRVLYQYNSGTMSRRAEGLNKMYPEVMVEMNPIDAFAMNIDDHSPVRIASRRGDITVRVALTEMCQRGTVFLPFHFREAAANLLTNPGVDPVSKIPEYKICAVRIRPVHGM